MSSLELRAVLIGEVSKRVLVIELLFRINSYNQVALCAEILDFISLNQVHKYLWCLKCTCSVSGS